VSEIKIALLAADAREERTVTTGTKAWELFTDQPDVVAARVGGALRDLAHVLDGENLRLGISDNLGFAALERTENVRRAAHVAKLAGSAGLITIVALVSPDESDRAAAGAIIGPERFLEVHLSAPVDACEARDEEGLYRRARAGEIDRFTGVSAPYEEPRAPALVLPTHEITVDESINRLIGLLADRGVLRR
jgi:adenylylsulfate kinase